MLSVAKLNVLMRHAAMMCVVMLHVVMLSVAKLKLLLSKTRAIFRGICQAENCQK